MAFCKLLTALVLLFSSRDLLGDELKSSIIGGKNAPKGKWPWMVHLNVTHNETATKKWRCGGTVLNKQWVLTAAHCGINLDYHRSFVVIGAYELQKRATYYRGILYFVPDPDFKALGNGYYKNDLALIKLKTPIEFSEDVKPVTLPSTSDTFGPSSECWITGWGYEKTGVPLSGTEALQELKISILPQSACEKVYPQITSNMLCAGDSNGGKDACKGDYGGPLVCRKGEGYKQVGVISYGSPAGCGLRDQPGVYTQVSKYLTFINDYIHRLEEASAEI